MEASHLNGTTVRVTRDTNSFILICIGVIPRIVTCANEVSSLVTSRLTELTELRKLVTVSVNVYVLPMSMSVAPINMSVEVPFGFCLSMAACANALCPVAELTAYWYLSVRAPAPRLLEDKRRIALQMPADEGPSNTASACSAPVALMVSWIVPTEKNEVLSLFMMELPTRVIKSPGALLVSGTIVALCPSVTLRCEYVSVAVCSHEQVAISPSLAIVALFSSFEHEPTPVMPA
mmetsp:Transcript_27896/g.46733  ORF Transcript_27896/g.46733 Transcript_27896/m.46733 type:complete len:234 (+) Transcript_27896:3386-4087(+)